MKKILIAVIVALTAPTLLAHEMQGGSTSGLFGLKAESPKAYPWLAVSTLALSCVSLGLGAWIARAGGEVSHSEFRSDQSPPEAPAHEHQHSGHPAQSSDTNATETHHHDETHAHPAEQTNGLVTEHSEHAESAHHHETAPPQSSTNPPANQT